MDNHCQSVIVAPLVKSLTIADHQVNQKIKIEIPDEISLVILEKQGSKYLESHPCKLVIFSCLWFFLNVLKLSVGYLFKLNTKVK